jgi:putative phosphoesterase
MQIAILSDTHNRRDMVALALTELHRRDVRTVLHCGDIEGPEIVELFAGLDAHFVLGNCDTQKSLLREAMQRAGVTFHDGYGDLDLDGKKLAFLHGHEELLMDDVLTSGHYDYLFHGHTHVARDEQSGRTRIINPGALHRAKPKTFVILDLATGQAESVLVAP